MKFTSCNDIFNRIDDKKKAAVMMTAVQEFSVNGFNSANINIIAERANVSVGSMYKYFESKRTLYMTCVEWTTMQLNNTIHAIIDSESDILVILEKIIRAIQNIGDEHKLFTRLYYEMATESNAEYAMAISSQLEGVTADLYASYIEQAKRDNNLDDSIDPRYFALFMDNLLMMLQFSYSCEYYKNRMEIYTYDDVIDNDDMMVEQLLLFAKRAIYCK